MSEDLKTHICTECTKHIGFTTEKGLTKHSRDVHGPRQKCPYCEFTYAISREDNLRRHIRIKHFSDSATRSTMDSRVVIDTSSQGVTENTELGSQSQLTEQIDEGPLDLSIKVTNQSPPRETQTIAACTEDTSKTPQFETTSQGSSPRPEVRSAVSVINPIRPLTTKKSTKDSSIISDSRRGAPSSHSFSRFHSSKSSRTQSSSVSSRRRSRSPPKSTSKTSVSTRPKSRSPSKSSSQTQSSSSKRQRAKSPSKTSSSQTQSSAVSSKSRSPSKSSSQTTSKSSSYHLTSRHSKERSRSPSKSSSHTKSSKSAGSSTERHADQKSRSPARSSSPKRSKTSTGSDPQSKSQSKSLSPRKSMTSSTSSTAKPSAHKSRSPSKTSQTKSRTSDEKVLDETSSSRQPRSPSKKSSVSKSSSMSLQERATSHVPHDPQASSNSPLQEKQQSPEKGSQRSGAVGLGQKRAADSSVASNVPAKFLRQRTLSDSSTSSSSSAGSGSSSSSSSSFTGMEDNIRLSPPPSMVSPLPPDGCPKSPVHVQEAHSEVSTKLNVVEETTSALPPTESLDIQDTDSAGKHPKSPVYVQETPFEVSTAEATAREETISALPSAESQNMQVPDLVAKHPKSQETIQSPEDVSQIAEGAALPQGGADKSNETQVQQAPESPRQLPGIIPLVSSVDEELNADRAAKLARIQQRDAEKANTNIETETARERAARLRRSRVFSPISSAQHQLRTFTTVPSYHSDDDFSGNHSFQSPDQEYNPGEVPEDRPLYIPTMRPYLPQPHHTDKRTCYEAMAADPRLAFCGAPSSDANSGVSTILRRVRRTVLTNGRRRIRTFFPENGVCMIKREEASLPNGTRYKLTTTWVVEPRESIEMPEEEQ